MTLKPCGCPGRIAAIALLASPFLGFRPEPSTDALASTNASNLATQCVS